MENTNETVSGNSDAGESEKVQTDTMCLLNKFCWPGFIMPQFWGIGNGLAVGIIAFIPILAPIMAFVFGFGGYQMAYEKSRHDKMTFYDIQVKWHKAAIIYAGVLLSLFLALGLNGIVNYVSNKNEISRIVKEFEEKKEQTVQNVETLLSDQYLKTYIGNIEFVPDGSLTVKDDGQVWHLENNYGYGELASKIINFEHPKMLSAYQYFSVGDGWKIEVFFSIDEEFQITESKFYLYSPEEVYLMEEGPGLLMDGDRWMQYMDHGTMERILQKKDKKQQKT